LDAAGDDEMRPAPHDVAPAQRVLTARDEIGREELSMVRVAGQLDRDAAPNGLVEIGRPMGHQDDGQVAGG
jgi:hypothetical protein